jgi:hypothetical protein
MTSGRRSCRQRARRLPRCNPAFPAPHRSSATPGSSCISWTRSRGGASRSELPHDLGLRTARQPLGRAGVQVYKLWSRLPRTVAATFSVRALRLTMSRRARVSVHAGFSVVARNPKARQRGDSIVVPAHDRMPGICDSRLRRFARSLPFAALSGRCGHRRVAAGPRLMVDGSPTAP